MPSEPVLSNVIVGACALMPHANREFELTKMGVLSAARGRKVGEFLLAGVIARAREMKAEGTLDSLFLLTNRTQFRGAANLMPTTPPSI